MNMRMDMEIIALEQSRAAFSKFSILCSILREFSLNANDETIEQLKAVIILNQGGMPLPSGRYGTVLAVALEMQLYQGALFMIKNADDLEIDLESVSSEYGGRNVWDAQKTFELSQLGFDKTKITDKDEIYKKHPWLIQFNNSNIDAALEISSILQEKNKSRTK